MGRVKRDYLESEYYSDRPTDAMRSRTPQEAEAYADYMDDKARAEEAEHAAQAEAQS